MSRGVVALTYHGFGEAAAPGAGARAAIPVAELEAQLEVIAAAGGAMDPRRATTGDSGIVLTFDDGERSVLTEALPRLARRGWVGAVFVTTGWIGRPGYLTAADLRRLRREGWLVGAHGESHRALPSLPPDELRGELLRSRARLARLLGDAPAHLAFPGGRTSPFVEDEARAAGFTTLWSSAPGMNAAMLPRGPLRRIAVRPGEPLGRLERLVRGDPLAHAAGRLDGALREAARRVLGDARCEALGDRVRRILPGGRSPSARALPAPPPAAGQRLPAAPARAAAARQPAIATSTSVGARTRTRSAGARPTRKPRDPPFT